MGKRWHVVALLGIFLLSAISPESKATDTATADGLKPSIEQLLSSENLAIDDVRILTRKVLFDVYRGNDFAAYWTSPDKIEELLELIGAAGEHGLTPSDYNVARLNLLAQEQVTRASVSMQPEAEILFSESLLRYAYHRRFGKVKASLLDQDINFRREAYFDEPYSVTFKKAFESSSLSDFIEVFAPTGPVYRQLQSRLKFYRDIAAKGGWLAIAGGPVLEPGEQDPRVVSIRKRLAITGRIADKHDASSNSFGSALEKAVRGFQTRHHLVSDGIVGPRTLAAMNKPVEARIDQIRLSLERLRWYRQEATETMVVVNIAGFRAFFVKDGKLAWETRAMVGKNYRQTPVFRGDIAYMEFNPTWTIPPGILRNDTLPAIKRDPGYLASKNIRVIDHEGQFVDPSTVDWSKYTTSVPYTLRQDPGPNNSLGTVKFIFPNKHFVFLHDTPHRELFSEKQRNFSSGCIRIEDPLALAELLMADTEKYNRAAFESIIESTETQRVMTSPKVPVVIIYLTASINSDGTLRFYDDIYQRDEKVLNALNGEVVFLPPGG